MFRPFVAGLMLSRQSLLACSAGMALLIASGIAPRPAQGDVRVDVRIDTNGSRLKGKLVDVYLTEYEIRMPAVIEEGWKTFRITNGGRVPHSLHLASHKKVWALGIAIAPGHTALVSLKLKEGRYRVWDPVEDYAAQGMQAVITVVDD